MNFRPPALAHTHFHTICRSHNFALHIVSCTQSEDVVYSIIPDDTIQLGSRLQVNTCVTLFISFQRTEILFFFSCQLSEIKYFALLAWRIGPMTNGWFRSVALGDVLSSPGACCKKCYEIFGSQFRSILCKNATKFDNLINELLSKFVAFLGYEIS